MMVFLRCSSGFCFYQLSLQFTTEGVVRNGKSTAGHQRYLCLTAVKHGNYSSLTPLLNPVRIRKSLIWPSMASDVAVSARIMGLASTRFYVN
jgi:transposase-like protein